VSETVARPSTPPTAELAVGRAIGHEFTADVVLKQALTHRSFVHERPDIAPDHNETLEFLGDSVVGLAAAVLLRRQFPDAREGELTRRRADLVCERTLARIAQGLDLGAALRLGKGEEKSGGRQKARLLASALEACIAAVLLDAGVERALDVASRLLEPHIDAMAPGEGDFKSRVQEHLQAAGRGTPRYELVGGDPGTGAWGEVQVGDPRRGNGAGAGRSSLKARGRAGGRGRRVRSPRGDRHDPERDRAGARVSNVMRRGLPFAAACLLATLPSLARADSTVLLEGEVPAGEVHFVLPFEVPAGTAEIEIRHDDLSETNILDWGILAPEGFRGYGGGNTEPAIVGVLASSRSYHTGPVRPGGWLVYAGVARGTELPARYRVEVLLRDAPTLAPEPERAAYAAPAALSTEARWYAGDFHVHSRESGDASPSIDEVLTFAESRGLDFVMLSEHNTTSQLELYAAAQARHPTVLLVPGIEVTTYQGHAMALGGTAWIDHRLGFEGRTMDAMIADAHASGALFSINHPALAIGDLCIGCGWMADADLAELDALEIQTGAYSVTGRLFYRTAETMWEDLVLAGHHVTAIGGSDDHRAGTGTGRFDSPIGSPTTMVFADELSVAAIVEGVRHGRTVVKLEGPEDPMLELRSSELAPSSDTIVADRTSLVVRVTDAMLGGTLRIVRDGAIVMSVEVTGELFEHEETLIAGSAESAIRAELVIGGQPRVVTSHVFLAPRTPGGPDAGLVADASATSDAASSIDAGAAVPSAGCACHVAGPPTSRPAARLATLALALLAMHRRRRSS